MTGQPGGERIAVLETKESLGIAIWKMPFFRALRRAYPGCTITHIAAGRSFHADLLRPINGSYVDAVIENAGIEKPLWAARRRLRDLPRFSLVYDVRTKGARVAWAWANLRHDRFVSMLPGFLLTTQPQARVQRPRHWVGRLMAMIEVATGRPADWRGRIELPPEAAAAAAHLLPGGERYVGLAPGAHGAYKVWPVDRFIETAHALAARGFRPVFLIGPDERSMVPQLRAAVPGALFPEVDRTDPFPTIKGPQLALALGERLAAAVANCTGIGHLLANAGTPLVSLFGPTDPRRFLPWTEPIRALRAQDFGADSDMSAIPVDAVVASVDSVVDAAASGAGAGPDPYRHGLLAA